MAQHDERQAKLKASSLRPWEERDKLLKEFGQEEELRKLPELAQAIKVAEAKYKTYRSSDDFAQRGAAENAYRQAIYNVVSEAEDAKRKAYEQKMQASLDAELERLDRKYDQETANRILDERIAKGDPADVVSEALGYPDAKDHNVMKTKIRKTWKYQQIGKGRYATRVVLEGKTEDTLIVVSWNIKEGYDVLI